MKWNFKLSYYRWLRTNQIIVWLFFFVQKYNLWNFIQTVSVIRAQNFWHLIWDEQRKKITAHTHTMLFADILQSFTMCVYFWVITSYNNKFIFRLILSVSNRFFHFHNFFRYNIHSIECSRNVFLVCCCCYCRRVRFSYKFFVLLHCRC